MEEYVSSSDNLIQIIWDGCAEWAWTICIAVLISSFVATRVITGFQNRPSQRGSEKPHTARMVPYWFPWIGHGFSILWNYLGYVEWARLATTLKGSDEH